MNKYFLVVLLSLFMQVAKVAAAPWQWSVEIKELISEETNAHPSAYLWIPENCKQVRAVIIGQHNMTEETIFEHPEFRKNMGKLGIAEIWITPGIDQRWDVTKGTQQIFETMMKNLSEISGYTELEFAPVIPIGHSAMATYPWNFAAWNPERTLAVLSIHGDSPRTHLTGYGRANLDWGTRTIEGIPSLMVMGEDEWWEDRLITSFDYRREYPNAPLSFLADAGHGHFDISDELIDYLSLFLKKTVEYRLPEHSSLDAPIQLIPVEAKNGWLADRWRKNEKPTAEAASYDKYKGDKNHAFWYFDKEMADATEKYYANERGKTEQYIGFEQKGKLITFNPKSHVRMSPSFQPEADGVTFHLKAVYTDTLRNEYSKEHSTHPIRMSRICGPVEMVNDTTFTVRFYRMGLDNPKRTGGICLMASVKQDHKYRSAVQQVEIRIPYRNKEGISQRIIFPKLSDVKASVKKISLNGTADSGLPVYYYVKEGPAEIKGDKLVLTKIPSRAKFPVKVTVVAWQYGRSGEPKVQTAEAVEQSFYITAR
ncbi:alpha/beta fold hydrolase [Bacteroides ovatus]|uniref:alpha/beta fold hydrolase n=1 Tax=Bacteroides ovatus TaxID=28116 RepID=UPI003567F980